MKSHPNDRKSYETFSFVAIIFESREEKKQRNNSTKIFNNIHYEIIFN